MTRWKKTIQPRTFSPPVPYFQAGRLDSELCSLTRLETLQLSAMGLQGEETFLLFLDFKWRTLL